MEGGCRKHFLVVSFPAQGHINPAIHLANRLADAAGACITFSTAVSAHRKMFPNLASLDQEVDGCGGNGPIAYVPFSDGYDEGFKNGVHNIDDFFSQSKIAGSQSLSSIIHKLQNSRGGRSVDCVIYTFSVPWAGEVAREHGIPSACYWIQPATVFAIYYHYFHGYDELIAAHCKHPSSTVELPGLPPISIRDLPSFLTTLTGADDPYSALLSSVKEAFLTLDRDRSKHRQLKVVVNTFDALEADALSAADNLELIAVGPILQSSPDDDNAKGSACFDLFEPDDEKRYLEWLDSKPKKSVVYVAFGSQAVVKKQQMEEIAKGLKASGRPYLWAARNDCRCDGSVIELRGTVENAMVVEWCSQVRVLKHPSVGCFVTHCGWNSALESLVFGVPTVGVPQWTDQVTNAMLMEKAWGTGVRGEINDDGVVEWEELRRCLDLVMGDQDGRGVEVRRNAEMWRKRAVEAVRKGGSSDRNLRAFVGEIAKSDQAF